MKLITGTRLPGGVEVMIDGKVLPLEPSLAIRDHSPTGFEWGYAGSGPSQLALAILLELYGPTIAQRYYRDFKFQFIAPANQDGFVLSSDDIQAWLTKLMEADEQGDL